MLTEFDWAAVDALSDAEIDRAIAEDADTLDTSALPDEGWAVVLPRPDIKAVRRKLGLTQQEFAARYGVPKRSLENWEQGRRETDAAVAVYLQLIETHPLVMAALVAEAKARLRKRAGRDG